VLGLAIERNSALCGSPAFNLVVNDHPKAKSLGRGGMLESMQLETNKAFSLKFFDMARRMLVKGK